MSANKLSAESPFADIDFVQSFLINSLAVELCLAAVVTAFATPAAHYAAALALWSFPLLFAIGAFGQFNGSGKSSGDGCRRPALNEKIVRWLHMFNLCVEAILAGLAIVEFVNSGFILGIPLLMAGFALLSACVFHLGRELTGIPAVSKKVEGETGKCRNKAMQKLGVFIHFIMNPPVASYQFISAADNLCATPVPLEYAAVKAEKFSKCGMSVEALNEKAQNICRMISCEPNASNFKNMVFIDSQGYYGATISYDTEAREILVVSTISMRYENFMKYYLLPHESYHSAIILEPDQLAYEEILVHSLSIMRVVRLHQAWAAVPEALNIYGDVIGEIADIETRSVEESSLSSDKKAQAMASLKYDNFIEQAIMEVEKFEERIKLRSLTSEETLFVIIPVVLNLFRTADRFKNFSEELKDKSDQKVISIIRDIWENNRDKLVGKENW